MMTYLAMRTTLASGVVALMLSACSTRTEQSTEPVDNGEVTEVVIRNFAFSAPTTGSPVAASIC